jgi:hypothetical protein
MCSEPMRRPLIILPVVLFIGLIGWGFLRPDFRPDPNAIAPGVRAELLKTGFKSTSGTRRAQFETVRSLKGETERLRLEQKIVGIDSIITEKWSVRRSSGLADESTGLYAGPIVVVRHNRAKPPIFGALFPDQFWSSTHLVEFVVEEIKDFPSAKGGRMNARVVYEDRYDGGELMQKERRRLQCEVKDVVSAASVNPGFSGSAARINCREELEPDGLTRGPKHPGTWSWGHSEFSHWYIRSNGWSIPIEGEGAMREGDVEEVRKWSTTLKSVETAEK